MKTLSSSRRDIYKEKIKFFSFRAIPYVIFLGLPFWKDSLKISNEFTQFFCTWLYIFFMIAQWFLLGKEIDYRLKIYYKINSSMDRILYRAFLGFFFLVLYFNVLNLFSKEVTKSFFWVTWIFLGLFHSWPTRGKIIKESVSTNLYEYKYLDRFEKTLLFLIGTMFIFSIVEFPQFNNLSAIKLFLDPKENFSSHFWGFLELVFFPFYDSPQLFRLAIFSFFYIFGGGLFLVTFYSFLRYFVSRRLSLLGVFAFISSWSFTKILVNNYSDILSQTFTLVWLWALLWTIKSSTYRSGLFLGFMTFWGTLLHVHHFILLGIQFFPLFFIFLKEKSYWYKRQFFKYLSFGLSLSLIIFMFENYKISFDQADSLSSEISHFLFRKGFLYLFPFGLVLFLGKIFFPGNHFIKLFIFEKERGVEVGIYLLSLFILRSFFFSSIFTGFSLLWALVFFSILPLEYIFQSMRRLRSGRNMVYLIYILICLLDSHFEGRVKIFVRALFN